MHVYLRKIPEIGQMAEFTCTFVCLLLILVKILKKTCIFALDQDKRSRRSLQGDLAISRL
ncbi:Uncharacterised protein [Chlamydia abortus]|nr:Uncharacterised protein [Chlamydia abortus]